MMAVKQLKEGGERRAGSTERERKKGWSHFATK